jgi:hypothetical protein
MQRPRPKSTLQPSQSRCATRAASQPRRRNTIRRPAAAERRSSE